jgi:hypothetical protein
MAAGKWWLYSKNLFWAELNAGCIGIAEPQDILGQGEHRFNLFYPKNQNVTPDAAGRSENC